MTPLVLLAGMNCTADLWTGCGLDDALTPKLTRSSIQAQIDALLAELPWRFVIGGLSLGAIVVILGVTTVASLLKTRRDERKALDA